MLAANVLFYAYQSKQHTWAAPVSVFEVPGAFEIPLAARRAAETGRFDAIVCLGCVIRGETPHFDFISQAVAQGIMQAQGATGVPMSFGVLTTHTAEQAVARAGAGPANKGWEAAHAALAMARLVRDIAVMPQGAP